MKGIYGILGRLGKNNKKANFFVTSRMLVQEIEFKGLITFTVLL